MSIIGDMLKAKREEAGLTIAQAADLLGVRWHQFWEWETGRKAPRDLDAKLAKLDEATTAEPTKS